MKILCTADIHIGRRASRISNPLAGDGDGVSRFSAANAWHDIVQCALDEKVDLLLIAGDLIDEENRYFEAYGPLEAGLRRLASQQIETIVVAGNHDVEVLPRLVNSLDNTAAARLRILGLEGQWERLPISRDGETILYVDGWSFPQRLVRQNPLAGYADFVAARQSDGAPILTLLHTDLDQRNSHYAPVMSRDLEALPTDFWLLGHIHLPLSQKLANGAHLLYPGSPLALDPGENGRHGPWLLTVEGGVLTLPQQRPLSRIRYETVSISLDGVHEPATFETHTISALKAALVQQIPDPDNLEIICTRLRFTGRSKLHRQIGKLTSPLGDLELPLHEAVAFVEKIENATQPDLDLVALAREASPVGTLASLLLELDKLEDDEQRPLHRGVHRKLDEVYNATTYSMLDSGPPEASDANAYLYRAGYALLDTLCAQKEDVL